MLITGAVLETIGSPRPFGASRPLTISTLELSEPQDNEVLVRIEAAGLCHSDLSVVDGNRVRPVPMLLGHEAAGIVERLGPLVDDLAVGDRVVMTFLPRCEECVGCAAGGTRPCLRGSASNTAGTLLGGGRRLSRDGIDVHHHLGVSAFATHAVVDTRSLVRVDHDVPADVAAVLGCAVLTGGGAVLNSGRPAP
ncbi:MAG: alcohol dehydrogenase catalytic domain-containing protein, partial [Aeromicrobium sp.]